MTAPLDGSKLFGPVVFPDLAPGVPSTVTMDTDGTLGTVAGTPTTSAAGVLGAAAVYGGSPTFQPANQDVPVAVPVTGPSILTWGPLAAARSVSDGGSGFSSVAGAGLTPMVQLALPNGCCVGGTGEVTRKDSAGIAHQNRFSFEAHADAGSGVVTVDGFRNDFNDADLFSTGAPGGEVNGLTINLVAPIGALACVGVVKLSLGFVR